MHIIINLLLWQTCVTSMHHWLDQTLLGHRQLYVVLQRCSIHVHGPWYRRQHNFSSTTTVADMQQGVAFCLLESNNFISSLRAVIAWPRLVQDGRRQNASLHTLQIASHGLDNEVKKSSSLLYISNSVSSSTLNAAYINHTTAEPIEAMLHVCCFSRVKCLCTWQEVSSQLQCQVQTWIDNDWLADVLLHKPVAAPWVCRHTYCLLSW